MKATGRSLVVAIGALLALLAGSGPATAESRFTDVDEGRVFYEEMVWAVDAGLMFETADGRFRPLDPVSRAEVSEVLYGLAGRPAFSPPEVSPFTDVSTSSDSYTAISWLAAHGISTGWSDGSFRPDQSVTRNAIAAFVYRFSGQPYYVAPAQSPFTDVTPSSSFYKEIAWLADSDISSGWADGTYRPFNVTTRDAMAAMANRIYTNLG